MFAAPSTDKHAGAGPGQAPAAAGVLPGGGRVRKDVEMASGVQRQCRLAIAVFDDNGGVRDTFRELRREGLGVGQLCLVALQGRLGEVHQPPADGLDLLCESVQDWPAASDGPRIVASAGPVLDTLMRAKTSGRRASGQLPISAEHTAELEAQIRRGAVVLVVLSSDPAQQRLSTRTLLGLSRHSVRTYEFTV